MENRLSPADEPLDEAIYRQLKAMARTLMTQERPNHTLSATDLVHEAFLKLSVAEMSFNDQKHYYHTFARQMRRVLLNHAAHKNTLKNRAQSVHLTESLGLTESPLTDFVTLDRAIKHLEEIDARSAQCIELVYFTHIKQAEAAQVMGTSLATLERDLKFGRVIIQEFINQDQTA